MNISYQLELRPELSTVYGPKDYTEFRKQLEQMDHLLSKSGAEDRFLINFIRQHGKCVNKVPFLRKVLRTLLLLNLTNESYRDLAFRLADSDLFRWFIGANSLKGDKTPSKSTIQRFEHLWSKEEIAAFVHDLNTQVSDPHQSEELLFDEHSLEIKNIYADSTCIQANIHHPVDWLLFRDAIRTLVGCIKLIRSQGLLHRMQSPDSFLSGINSLSIAITQTSHTRNGKKERKKIFRKMKKLLRKMVKHALRYYSLLEEKWSITDLSEKQTKQILQRISNVIEQIPAIIKNAHTRIISEKKIENSEKILSLYEKNIHVIKRGKMDADVEFGNGFYLAEQEDGLIVDWDFIKETKTDTQLLKESVERIVNNYDKINKYATDRGFNSKRNSGFLDKEHIFNATCPRDPQELTIKMKDDQFLSAQKRRAQTEGRIGIFKNKFIGRKIPRKGFDNRETKILWSILTHNLWVVARIANKNYEQRMEELAQAA